MEQMKFEISENGEEALCDVSLEDKYYDLLEGGYLRPDRFLKNPEQIKLVEDAVRVVNQYLNMLEQYTES